MFTEKTVKDITGKKFNHLTAIRFDKRVIMPGKKLAYCHYWFFKCDCGNVVSLRKSNVIKNNSSTTSCGCVNTAMRKYQCRTRKLWTFANAKNTIHGLSSSNFAKVFSSMRQRCSNINNSKFYLYGGKGIVCEWSSLLSFKKDMYKSYLKHIETFGTHNTTIERIDGDKNYSKKNCKWATYKEQNNNTSRNHFLVYKGDSLTLSQLSRVVGISPSTLSYRIKKYNGNIELAIENPTSRLLSK